MDDITPFIPAIAELIRAAVEAASELLGDLPPNELDIPSEIEIEKEQEK